MKLLTRWKTGGIETIPRNNKSILIGNERGLFDDIYGVEDLSDLFKMAIEAETPVHSVFRIWEIVVFAFTYTIGKIISWSRRQFH
jgi:hypothetical protein